MARSRSEAIADAIARRIMANTRKRFSTLHAEAISEVYMNTRNTTPCTTGMAVGDSEASRTPIDTGSNTAALEAEGQKPLAGASDNGKVTSGMTVGSQVNVGGIKPVDRKTLTGSTPGDFRKSGDFAKASVDEIANAGGPRDAAKQFQNSRNDKGGAFQQTIDPTDAAN